MTASSRWPYAEAHRRASAQFRRLTPAEQLQRMRAAGVLGVTPQVGDKVRVLGRFALWHYGVVVGASADGRVHVVHNDKVHGVVVTSLDAFANGQRVEMVQRAPAGREIEVATRALQLLGRPYDLLSFNCEHLATYAQEGVAQSPQVAVAALLAAAGLAAIAAVTLSGDREWDEHAARYRDARGRFTSR